MPLGGGEEASICARFEQLLDGRTDAAEIRQNDPESLLADPFRVVSLLRQSPRIALKNNRQPHRYRLADASRAGFADEVVRELHILRNLVGEPFDKHGGLMRQGAKFG